MKNEPFLRSGSIFAITWLSMSDALVLIWRRIQLRIMIMIKKIVNILKCIDNQKMNYLLFWHKMEILFSRQSDEAMDLIRI